MRNADATIEIIKASGEPVPFSPSKLHRSLQRSGAGEEVIQHVMNEMQRFIKPGMTTRQIFKHAFNILKKKSQPLAARYRLKQAMMELGPTGYPFEQLVADILRSQGFSAQVGVIMKGKCVNHEIDVMATNGGEQLMVECKFHNRPGIHCDVKVPLYIHSRFNDVRAAAVKPSSITSGWIFTNTRFSEDAIQYATCVGLHLTGWNYPHQNSLEDLIDRYGLHPITCLTSLTSLQKSKLMEQEIIHCKDLLSNKEVLLRMGVTVPQLNKIVKETISLTHHLELV